MKPKAVKIILIAILIAVVLLPLYSIVFIYPSFNRQLIKNMEAEAARVATHMLSMAQSPPGMEMKRDSLPQNFHHHVKTYRDELGIAKIKVFSKSGEVIYSTDAKELGDINRNEYFHETVAKGRVHSSFIEKGSGSMEGQKTTTDVASIYVPIMSGNRFIGAFEIYYDIAERKETFDALTRRYSGILLLGSLLSIGMVILLFFGYNEMDVLKERLLREIEDRKRIEDNLNRAQEVAHIGSWHLDIPKNELIWSKDTYSMFDVSFDTPLTYETFLNIVHPDDRTYVEHCWKAALSGEPYNIRHRIVVNGKVKWVHERAEFIFNEKGEPLSGTGTVQDITETKMAEDAIRHSKKFNEIVLNSMGESISIVGVDRTILSVNRAFLKEFNLEGQDVIGKRCYEVTHHAEKPCEPPEHPCPLVESLRSGEKATYEHVHLYEYGSGKYREITTAPIKDADGNIIQVVHVSKDVTDRKKAEDELKRNKEHLEKLVSEKTIKLHNTIRELQKELTLRNDIEGHLRRIIKDAKALEAELLNSHEQLRALAEHLEDVREEERKYIAREIHDELGQGIAGLKLLLMGLLNTVKKADDDVYLSLQSKIASMSNLIDEISNNVHKISMKLRPGVLDHLGLVAAVQWKTQNFQEETGIGCMLECDEDITAGKEVTTAMFRILQESLTNIIKYAGATSVAVRLKQKDGSLTLKVKDNGRGIREDEINRFNSFGLLGMRERVQSLGGNIIIKGVPDTGTTVAVSIPQTK